MKVLLVVSLLVSMTTALKCYEKAAVAVPADDAKQEWGDGEYKECDAAILKCYNTTWSVGGAAMIKYGCGDEDMCTDVNTDKRKKRDASSETEGCTATTANVTPQTFDEGEVTLACEEGYTADNADDSNVLRYCYNGMAWLSYQYAGEEEGDYEALSCSINGELWYTVTYEAATETRPIVEVAGVVVSATTNKFLKSADSLVVTVSCMYGNYEEDTDDAGTAWPTTLAADLDMSDLKPCKVSDGYALVEVPALLEDNGNTGTFTVKDTSDTLGTLPFALSDSEDSELELTCEDLYILKNSDVAGDPVTADQPLPLVYDPTTDPTAFYLANDTDRTALEDDSYSCILDTTAAVIPDIPGDRHFRLCTTEDCDVEIEAGTAVGTDLYVVCKAGYTPPDADAVWAEESHILLTLDKNADPAKLTYANGEDTVDWAAETIEACVVEEMAGCPMSTLADLHLALFDPTDLDTAIADTSVDKDHGEKVVVKCNAVGYLPGYTNDVALHTYMCNSGSWGTIYATCDEYTDCTTTTCEENACNSSTRMFAGLSLVVAFLISLII